MKKIIFTAMLLLCSVLIVSGRDFDITGTYLGESDGMTVRIDVLSLGPEGYRFSFIALEEESPVFTADYSETGEYLFDDDGDLLRLTFKDDTCDFDNGDRVLTFTKEEGEPLSHPGYYTLQAADDVELVLQVAETDSKYTFSFKAWKTETVIAVPQQEGNIFTVTSDWGDTVTLEFTARLCLFTGESEGHIELIKSR